MTERNPIPAKVRSIWPPVLLLAMSVGYTIWAQDYNRIPAMMPTIVGVTTAVLCVLDILSRLENPLAKILQLLLGADFRNREMNHDPYLREEVIQVGWMVLCIAAMLFIGILPTVPLFIVGYMHFFGDRRWVTAILSGVTVFIFVYIVFEVLLDYSLYRGVLFDPQGFGAW